MIKQQEYVEAKKHERIDALALALGFKFDGNGYVKAVRSYTRKIKVQKIVAPVVIRRKRKTPHERFTSIHTVAKTMTIGQVLDISNEIATSGVTKKIALKLLRTWAWHQRKRTPSFDFQFLDGGTAVTVHRVA